MAGEWGANPVKPDPMASNALFPLAELYRKAGVPVPRIAVCDIGAMSLGEGCDVYTPLLRQGLCDVVGFEPVEAECEKLNQKKGPVGCKLKFLPHFIGDGNDGEFRTCSATMTSSLFEPNTPLLGMFQNLEELMRVTERNNVKTTRLDDLREEVGSIDFLKMDVQGGELGVIQGAFKSFESVCVLETEVEFVHMYKQQPLFAEIDTALRKQGFEFHKFHSIMGRCMKPLYMKENPYQSLSQQLWGDAIYVKGLFDLSDRTLDEIAKTALILHELYGSYDVVSYLLGEYDKRDQDGAPAGRSLQQMYLQELKVT